MYTVTDSIRIAASPERVFTALTDAAELARWWPKLVESEPQAGGRLRFIWFNDARIDTAFETFEPGRALAFPFASEHVSFELGERDAETLLTVHHSRIDTTGGIEHVEHIAQSWTFLLCNLKCVLERDWDLRPSRL